ncbi:hypothetical protein VNO80_01804 [Phaseolus coccineus]|uniref:Uncharacterized protein n=1 Tax=Phaseolus coccineus TaxID=3886 RepID=A0AAN9RT60_PHACN
MSTVRRLAAQAELKCKLFSATGDLRSEFKGITYSDYKNLMQMATKEINTSLSFDPYHTFWLKVLQELQSMEDEFVPNVRSGAHGAVIPIPIPNPHAGDRVVNNNGGDRVVNNSGGGDRVVNNSGEQNFRGLVNQTGYVSGYANGAIFSFLDCNFSYK